MRTVALVFTGLFIFQGLCAGLAFWMLLGLHVPRLVGFAIAVVLAVFLLWKSFYWLEHHPHAGLLFLLTALLLGIGLFFGIALIFSAQTIMGF